MDGEQMQARRVSPGDRKRRHRGVLEEGAGEDGARLQDRAGGGAKKREQLERRVNELVAENQRSRKMAEEADRSATIRAELQRLGVAKVDLAFKAVKDEIFRAEDGGCWREGTTGR